jgi:hypothetical protein
MRRSASWRWSGIFLARGLGDEPARTAWLVDHDDPALPVVAQCRLLKGARSTLYY